MGNIVINKCSCAPIQAKIQLLKLYCCPIHGWVLWCNSNQYATRKFSATVPQFPQLSLVIHPLVCGVATPVVGGILVPIAWLSGLLFFRFSYTSFHIHSSLLAFVFCVFVISFLFPCTTVQENTPA